MKFFLNDNFLLETPVAQDLYHNHAAQMPIIDYHCHLDPKLIAENYRFSSITELWLGGDHYKWRALRSNGINEHYITGKASDWEKFQKWAQTVPYCFRNPLYHWTHLELKTAFGIDKRLNPETAREIFEECNYQLQNNPDMTARGLMNRYNVEVVCTTDDPVDSLEYHKQIALDGFDIQVLPTWRPDKAMAIENPTEFQNYLHKLESVSNINISDFEDFLIALKKRHDYFAEVGCKLSDHGLTEFYDNEFTEEEIRGIFNKVISNLQVSEEEIRKFKTKMLYVFGKWDYEKDWTQQFHYGTIRNANTKMLKKLGPDTGFDSIGEWLTAESCAHFLDHLNSEGKLTKTILYNLNPSDNEMIATMIGNFQDGSIPGKIQFGSAWWFNDQLDGMTRQINVLSQLGLLSRFVGMLTDSRSFLSYPRHEYFRRNLCNIIGNDIENGLIPNTGYEGERVRQMIEDICYYNAKGYFNF